LSTHSLHEPAYRRDLGNGLVLRWSTAQDTEAIGQLFSFVFRDNPDLPLNSMITVWTADLMSGRHPLCNAGAFALVEDTRQGQVVAATGLMEQQFEYEGIALPMGRPEIVASHPDYRNRGLVRAVFKLIHARSAAQGHLAQGITGIPYYYRQFGYEYALDLGGGRGVPLGAVPKLKDGETEPFRLRDATLDDLPQLLRLYDRERSRAAVSTPIDASYWNWLLAGQRAESGEGWNIKMIVDAAGTSIGYTLPRRLRWGERFAINGLAVEPGIALAPVLPSVLRALRDEAQRAGAWISVKDPPPASVLFLHLGRAHPVYDLLGTAVASRTWPPYAWYIRVPDVPALIGRLAPLLERRLAGSAAAHHSGELRLDFYRGGLRMAFEQGRLAGAEEWRAQVWGTEGNAGFPPLVFLQLLFGHRSLEELRDAYADVWVSDEAQPVLEVLFPKRSAFVMPLD
jgi:predicted N-acetyltransferase YhbS